MTRILQALKQLETRAEDKRPEQINPASPPRDEREDVDLSVQQLSELHDMTSTELAPAFDDATDDEPEPAAQVQSETRWLPAKTIAAPTELENTIRKSLDDPALEKQYRQTAERILANLPAGIFTSALFCSSQSSASCCSLTAHLGTVLAESDNEPVLLIDGQLADHTLTSQLDCVGENGLAEVLSGRENWQAVVRGTSFDRLCFMPSGSDDHGDESTAAVGFAELLEQIRGIFRMVLVCGGDADEPLVKMMSRICHATYFHVQLGKTKAAIANTAVQQLKTAGARLLGCVAT